jgi:acetamidase/formamidase
MARHTLKANINTVHTGGFSPLIDPALCIHSCDIVDIETYSSYTAIFDSVPDSLKTKELIDICKNLPETRKTGNGPHILTGPIYINNSEPGDLLEIRLMKIYPSQPMGFNLILPDGGVLPDEFDYQKLNFIPVNLKDNIVEFPENSNIRIPLRPFFGILGVATNEVNISSHPPGKHGGNIDNRELTEGSRIFIPVQVPGGMFSVGDGHAVQGDGEVNQTALEISTNGTLQIILHKKALDLTSPIAESKTHWITMGFQNTLDDAFIEALQQMIKLLTTFYPLTKEEAYSLCSLTASFRITQAVNLPNKGVHGMIPKSIFSGLPATGNQIQEWKI